MTEPNLDELNRALAIINDAAQAGKDFVWEQAPLVAREVVAWTIANAAISAGFTLFLLVAMAIRSVKARAYFRAKWDGFDNNDKEGVLMFGGIVGVVTILISLICLSNLLDHTRNLAKGLLAPRIAIIDYVAERARR